MALWKRVLGAVVLLGILFGINSWAGAMEQAISQRPDLQQHPFYGKFELGYTVVLEVGRWIILAVSLNLINGIAGQFSLGHAAFAAVGGYTAAAVTVFIGPRFAGNPAATSALLAAALLLGGLAAACSGFIVGLPSLRLRGDYLAIVTLGFGEVVRVIIQHIDAVGGSQGFNGIPILTNFFWMYLVVVITILVARNILQSGHGRALLAIREDEIAAEAMGVPLTRYKVMAFVIGAFFAGLAGGLYAHRVNTLQPEAAGFLDSIQIVTMVVLGGSGSITGAVLAATLLTLLPEILRTVRPDWEAYRMPIYALLLIVLMLTRPQGLLGSKELSFAGFRRKGSRDGGPGSGAPPTTSGEITA